jgi:hypothetical protein
LNSSLDTIKNKWHEPITETPVPVKRGGVFVIVRAR